MEARQAKGIREHVGHTCGEGIGLDLGDAETGRQTEAGLGRAWRAMQRALGSVLRMLGHRQVY